MNKQKTMINWQLYLGITLVLTGGLFLADQLLSVNVMRYFWPLLIVLFGSTFLVGMLIAGKKAAGLAIPGTIITALGLLIFIQNAFDLWITWTYAWGLLISVTGLGLIVMNLYLKRLGLRRVGGVLIGIGLIAFVTFGIFFEIVIKISGSEGHSSIFLGGGLVLLGLFLVFIPALFSKPSKPAVDNRMDEEGVVDAPFEDVDVPGTDGGDFETDPNTAENETELNSSEWLQEES